MKTRVTKIIVLGMLIILCIGQISILWLGNASSPNFFDSKTVPEKELGMKPKMIWANTGLAYKISQETREYSMLVNELQGSIAAGNHAMTLEKNVDMDYEKLLGMPGIIYEYSLDITLEQAIGAKVDKYDETVVFNELFVDMSSKNDNRIFLYLVCEEEESIHKVTVFSKLQGHVKLLERLSDNSVANSFTVYQPSITSENKQFIKGNVFLPLNSREVPMKYEPLKVSNTIEALGQEEKMEVLEDYVKSFFINPLLKEIDQKEDGIIIFSENRRALVKYNPLGTLEFNNTSPSEDAKLTKVQRLKKIKSFINESTGIPEYLKKGAYIAEISHIEDEYTYKFDYRYNGFRLQLKENVKKQLAIENVLELTIKNNQIVKGKWIVLDIEEVGQSTAKESEYVVARGYGEIIDKIYMLAKEQASSTIVLDDIECSYVMTNIEGNVSMDWVVNYKDEWYYP